RQILSKGDSDVKDENMRKSKKNEENINLLREAIHGVSIRVSQFFMISLEVLQYKTLQLYK
ncbi:hypothetical protein J2Z45_003595, partial [Cohnella lubricantis]